jgi:acetyl esterase/lipase
VHKDLTAAAKSVAILFVVYSLTPEAVYPTQIQEAVDAIMYILEEKHRSPSEVIIGGDSAGGGLSLAILSHLSHPIPDVPVLKINGQFKALVLIAPWISFTLDWPSVKKNHFKDCAHPDRLKSWAADYKGGNESNYYMEAADAPASWWEGAQVEQLLCTAGSDEILVDSISHWIEKYKVSNVLSLDLPKIC